LVLLLATVGFLLVTLARPMRYAKANEEELQGIPYIVALDASRSMLATDVKPSRYGAASNALDRWIQESSVDRIGLITFAGDAYLNAPITFDIEALRTVLRFIEPDEVYEGGSSLAKSIERVGQYFVSNNVPQRVLIIMSDGEELEGSAIEEARKWHNEAKMVISTVGIGTSTGAKVPANRKGGAWGNAKNTFGQEVTSRLDEGNLKRIANAGGGKYYALGANGEGLDQLRREVLRAVAEAAAKDNLNNYRDMCQIPLVLSLLVMLVRLGLRPESHQQRPVSNKQSIVVR
jgi:Ca-activated chloride channel family protein